MTIKEQGVALDASHLDDASFDLLALLDEVPPPLRTGVAGGHWSRWVRHHL